MIGHPLRRRVHAARPVEHLERPRPAARERLGGGTGLGRLRHREARLAQIEHRHVGLDHIAALHARHRHAEHARVALGGLGDVGDGDVDALRAQRAVGMLAGVPAATPGQRRQMLDEEDRQRVARAEPRRPPAQLLPGRRAPAALVRIAHVDAARAHRGHVGGEIVALQRDVA